MKATGVLVALITFFGFVSCETELDYNEQHHNPVLVTSPFSFEDDRLEEEGIKGFSTNSQSTDILLTASDHVFGQGIPESIPNATVQLREVGEEWVSFSPKEFFLYTYYTSDDILIKENTSYEYRASVEGFDDVSGEFRIPSPVKIKEVEFVRGYDQSESPFGFAYMEFDLTFEDPPGNQYYSITCQMKNDRNLIQHRITTNHPSAQSFNFHPQYFFYRDIFLTDQALTDQEATVRIKVLNLYAIPWGYDFSFTLHTHDEHSYKYNSSVQRQRHYIEQEVPQTQPVVIYSNIENGLGYVGGFSSDNFKL